MTDAEIDKLDGVELRKAVAEAAGWEWRKDPWGGEAYTGEESTSWFTFLPDRDWNHAIKACESAGVAYAGAIFGERTQVMNQGDIYDSSGCTPESLCRSLLKAIEEKNQ